MGTASQFVAEFQKLVGTIGGDKIRKWYNENVANIGNSKWFWCVATVVYCAYRAKVTVCQTAGSSSMLTWFKQKGRFYLRDKRTPKKGDLILFDYIEGDGYPASHIGVVEKCSGGIVYTIEGNSGNREDGEVMRHSYSTSNKNIVGYCVPEFAPEKPKKVAVKRNCVIYKYAFKDVVGKASPALKHIKKGVTVTMVADTDDGFGWCKVKYDGVTGWIMNNHLKTTGLSDFKKYTLKKDTKATLIKDKKLSKKVTLKSGTEYKMICEIEKGAHKGKIYIAIGAKRYYI